MHRHGSHIADGFHIPDLPEQLIFGKHMVRMLGQKSQQVKLFGGKLLLLIIDPYAAGCFVNPDSPDFDHIINLRVAADQALVAGQVGFHPGHQLAGGKRFGNIVIRSQPQAADLVDIILFGGHHEDRRIFHLTDPLADLKSVSARKHQVQNVHVEILRQGAFQSFRSVIFHFYFKSAELQIILFQFSDGFFIFYD